MSERMQDAWGEFLKLGLIRDWPQEQAEVVFLAFSAGATAAAGPEFLARYLDELRRLRT